MVAGPVALDIVIDTWTWPYKCLVPWALAASIH